ncbi:MAG: protein kinase [Clostridiales bacterium]|nr:protein kinase [Clostridiales bacterium]
MLLRSLIYNVMNLHEHGIVHADLKPTNFIIKETAHQYHTIKLIDYDNSFLVDAPPKDIEAFSMDPVYMAPEVLHFIAGEDVTLTHKLDIFSLGIILHELLSGTIPTFPNKENHYLYEAVLKNEPYVLASSISKEYRLVIEKMLSPVPEERPELKAVFEELENKKPMEIVSKTKKDHYRKERNSYLFAPGDL